MSLLTLLIIIILALAIGVLARGASRSWVLLVASILVIYWLQPGTPIRHLDFWLPTLCILLSILAWAFTAEKGALVKHGNLIAWAIIAAAILLIGLTRYLGSFCCLTPTQPPEIYQIAIMIIAIGVLMVLATSFSRIQPGLIVGLMFLILVIFVVLKSDPLARLVSQALRTMNGQNPSLASSLDIRWLGFSYVAFRLLHTLRDRLNGRLPDLTLKEFIIFIIFFPAFNAGPIDRVQRFTKDLQQPFHLSTDQAILGGKRILIGIFRKFVLADGLALFALNITNADQVNSAGWLWLMVYAYAFRIYFDFSGYTDIAIGMGTWLGIQLPENFDHPYLKSNLTLFWNSWHMTLAGWFRAYFFNPLTRTLRSQPLSLPLPLIIFIGQLSTFLLIGLWHGITWNFAIWGAWHGLGLFIHNRWSDRFRAKTLTYENQPRLQKWIGASSTLLTFHYVTLGWIWFALATPSQSWNTLLKLFGIS